MCRVELVCSTLYFLVSTLYFLRLSRKKSGRQDLNLRPPGPEPGALAKLSHAPEYRDDMVHPGLVRYSSKLVKLVNVGRDLPIENYQPRFERGGAMFPRRGRFIRHRLLRAAAMFSIAVITGLAGVALAGKAKFNKVVNIGDKAPVWSDLPGVDGKTHSLADYREAKAVVVVFTCNHCPVAKQYAERLAAFAKKYDKQVQIVAISVSHHGADRLDQMKARATEKAFPYAYLYDESQQSGRSYGATATPHFFLLDGERMIAYMGAFDDNIFDPEKAEKHYLIDAADAVLAGQEPKIKESLQRGCAIEYE